MEKIQELTEKIYREGVEKGQAEADRIVEQAKAEAQRILDEARAQVQAMEANAAKKNQELASNTKNELKLYTSQALSALKSEIANVLTDKVVKNATDSLVADKNFLGQFTVALASKWASEEPVVISTSEAESLKNYFAAQAKDLLDNGVTIQQVNGKEALFSIQPADGSYVVNFGKEEFESYFKNFLRPQLIEMLF